MASINFNANTNSIEGKSHVILRTNPLLTSNVKLVVDSAGEIYLDSINANRTLSDQRYKKFNLDRTGHFAYDIASFYAGTPFDTVYEPLRRDSDLSVYRAYNKQYEEQYHYGARLNGSKTFDENIRFMAPLWIDEKLPEYFAIYRIEEPVAEQYHIYTWSTNTLSWIKGALISDPSLASGYNVQGTLQSSKDLPATGNALDAYLVGGEQLEDNLYSINARLMEMLSNATLVKTYDLKKGSVIGDYLDTFTNDPARPKAPLTMSFQPDEKSSFNGIDIRKGGFASKAEYIYRDFIGADREEILNNKFITEGFKRTQLISANLINMEFLFEDFDNAYDVNRYIGIYVNAHEEGSFKHLRYKNNRLVIDASTVKTTFDLSGTVLQPVDMLPKPELVDPILQWVKSGDSFAHVRNNANLSNDDALKLNVNAFNINTAKYIKKNDTLRITNILQDAKDYIKLHVLSNPQNAEKLIITTYTEYLIANDPIYYELTADASMLPGEFAMNKFSNQGSVEDVAKAIKGALTLFEDLTINIKIKGSELLFENYKPGNRTASFFISTDNNYTSFEVEGLAHSNELDLDPYILTEFNNYIPFGGSYGGYGFLIEESETGDIDDNTYIKSGDSFVKIVEVVKDPVYTNYYRVCLDAGVNLLKLKDNSIALWTENRIKFGKFEALDFHDFDYNFYSTANSKLGELEYEINDIKNVDPGQLESLSSGFKTLEGIKNVVTPNTSGVTSINSEYDRLKENYTTELGLESRVVPTINKWAYKDGVNAKELPYMLTMSEAFGKTNFSPDIEKSGRDINSLTHEWFYLYKHPVYTLIDETVTPLSVAGMVKDLKSYIQPESSINLDLAKLTDVNNDWFDRLFIYDGYDLTGIGFAPAIPAKKYTRLQGGSTESAPEALFRGLKVKLYERKEFNETNPKNLIRSSAFNDYKFTAVLNYNTGQNEDNVTIKAVQNKAFKFVCLYIEVNTKLTVGIESLNRTLLYSMRDIYDNGGLLATGVNGYLDFSGVQSGNPTELVAQGVNTKLLRDIQLNEFGNYNNIEFDYNGDTWVLPVKSVDSNTQLTIRADFGKVYNIGGTQQIDLTLISSAIWETLSFEYANGGYNLAKSLFESVSAKSIADLLNNNDTETIQYLTVEEDGTINPNRFIINIEDGHKVKKYSKLIANSDPNKPNSYKVAAGSIGYVVEDRITPYHTELVRMSGNYTPLSRPVVMFTDIYPEYKTTQLVSPDEREQILYNKYNRLGMVFMSYMDRGQYKYGLIEDLFYHKVNPEKADGILKLSNTSGSQPKYPLIDEVAIAKRDINVFRSSWEDKFYTKNGSNRQNENVYGTLSAYEESAFLASTLNLPKAQYDITSYTDIKLAGSLDAMKSIKSAGNFTGDLVQFEDADRIYIDMYLNNLLIDLLEADNAGNSIERFVLASQSYGDKTSIKDDIRKYIEVNLLKLMNINEIRIWSKDDKTISASVVNSATTVNDILDSNYTESKDFRIEYDTTNPLNIRLIYNKRAGFRHQLYIYTKIRS